MNHLLKIVSKTQLHVSSQRLPCFLLFCKGKNYRKNLSTRKAFSFMPMFSTLLSFSLLCLGLTLCNSFQIHDGSLLTPTHWRLSESGCSIF